MSFKTNDKLKKKINILQKTLQIFANYGRILYFIHISTVTWIFKINQRNQGYMGFT